MRAGTPAINNIDSMNSKHKLILEHIEVSDDFFIPDDVDSNKAFYNGISSEHEVNYNFFDSFNGGLIEQSPIAKEYDYKYNSNVTIKPESKKSEHYKKIERLLSMDYNNPGKLAPGEKVSKAVKSKMDANRNWYNKWQDINNAISYIKNELAGIKGISDIDFNNAFTYVEHIAYNKEISFKSIHSRLSITAIILCIFKAVCESLGYHVKGFYKTKICIEYGIKKEHVQLVTKNLNELENAHRRKQNINYK